MYIWCTDDRKTYELHILDIYGSDWFAQASQADDNIEVIDDDEREDLFDERDFDRRCFHKANAETIDWWKNICDMTDEINDFRLCEATTEQLHDLEVFENMIDTDRNLNEVLNSVIDYIHGIKEDM